MLKLKRIFYFITVCQLWCGRVLGLFYLCKNVCIQFLKNLAISCQCVVVLHVLPMLTIFDSSFPCCNLTFGNFLILYFVLNF